jgi:acetyl esterase
MCRRAADRGGSPMRADEPESTDTSPGTARKHRRGLKTALIAIAAVVVIIVTAFVVSPWPGSMVIRSVFEYNANQTLDKMDPYSPDGITVKLNESYRAGDPDAVFDVYYPDRTVEQQPTVFWVHGGAWISGGAADDVPYFKLLAAEGYTVIGVDYTLAPEATYPNAVHQLNDALAYVMKNAERLNIDPDRIAFAGDSAGSQLSSQLATMITSPEYAEGLGIDPALTPDQLKGVILNCGIYDVPAMLDASGLVGWGVSEAIWAVAGTKNFGTSEAVAQMSTLNFVTDDFPPAYISGGNGDPLTDTQSKPLAEKLEDLGVVVTTLFWPKELKPSLPHEYQFHLDRPEARAALAETIAFMDAVLK